MGEWLLVSVWVCVLVPMYAIMFNVTQRKMHYCCCLLIGLRFIRLILIYNLSQCIACTLVACVRHLTQYCIRVDNKTLLERDARTVDRTAHLFLLAFTMRTHSNSTHSWNAISDMRNYEAEKRWKKMVNWKRICICIRSVGFFLFCMCFCISSAK